MSLFSIFSNLTLFIYSSDQILAYFPNIIQNKLSFTDSILIEEELKTGNNFKQLDFIS